MLCTLVSAHLTAHVRMVGACAKPVPMRWCLHAHRHVRWGVGDDGFCEWSLCWLMHVLLCGCLPWCLQAGHLPGTQAAFGQRCGPVCNGPRLRSFAAAAPAAPAAAAAAAGPPWAWMEQRPRAPRGRATLLQAPPAPLRQPRSHAG